jgi:peptide/nickel transport system permease protein
MSSETTTFDQVSTSGAPGAAILRSLIKRQRSERRWEKASLAIGAGLIGLLAVLAFAHPLLGLPGPDEQNLAEVLQAPSSAHFFGTDTVGRDIFSRCLAGLQLDLLVAVEVTLLSVVIGIAMGTLAGFFGGLADTLIMRLADIVLALPFMVLVIAVIAAFGPGLTGVYVAVPLAGWAVYARFTRAEMLSIRERDFVNAARTLGYSRRRILLRHALPNVIQPAIVYCTIDVVFNIVLLASLSFLGLGVQPPTAELGGIISEGQEYVLSAWWISVLPGFVLVLVGIGFSLIGDGLAARLGQDVSWGK